MTWSALAVMIPAWFIIVFFTVRFFLKVLRAPSKQEAEE